MHPAVAPDPAPEKPSLTYRPPTIVAKGRNRQKIARVSLIVLLVIVLMGIVGFQKYQNSKYFSKVRPLYVNQSSQMKLVYQSFSRPVFSSNKSTQQGDKEDLQYINAAIKQANADTATLRGQNKFIGIPLVKMIPGLSDGNKQSSAMQNYLSDCADFLSTYQKLATYTQGLDNLETSFNEFSNALVNMLKDTTPSQISTDSLSASTTVNSTLSALNKLDPPPDLIQFNAQLIGALKPVATDLDGITTGVNSKNANQIVNSDNNLVHDLQALGKVLDTDLAGKLQNGSQISRQIKKLQSEAPLGSGVQSSEVKVALN